VAVVVQLRQDVRSDEPGGAGECDFHGRSPSRDLLAEVKPMRT
jgi:hypothetical protein